MQRLLGALREWLQLRSRLHGERRFHLENAAADFRSAGMSPAAARRKARARFGSRRHSRLALRELGGDIAGLAFLLRAHRVSASAWLQPIVLFSAIVSILLLSPAPRALIEAVIGTPLASRDRESVVLAAEGWTPSERVISQADFEILHDLRSLTGVERYQTIYLRARAVRGFTLAAIQSEVRARTGNRTLWAGWLSSQNEIVTAPARIVWILIWFHALFSLRLCIPSRGKSRWLLYGLGVALLHTVTSLMAWALAAQIWKWAPSPGTAGIVVLLLFVGYALSAAAQCRCWWTDLNQRCPICLDRLVMPLTEGAADRVLLGPAITESVCAHGHGVLVESRWSSRFRPEESPLRGLVRV